MALAPVLWTTVARRQCVGCCHVPWTNLRKKAGL